MILPHDVEQFETAPAIGLRIDHGAPGEMAPVRFGGHPQLPDHMAWPHDSAERPMHHLMQVDCASLPRVDADFPSTGTLFLFVTGSWDERNAPDLAEPDRGAYQVIYDPKAVHDLPLRPHPQNCPALGDKSYALNDILIPAAVKKQGLLTRIFNTQPTPYQANMTGYFAPVALTPFAFNAHPSADPAQIFEAFGALDDKTAITDGLRPMQMLGYAPQAEYMNICDAAGYMVETTEKAQAAFALSQDEDNVLLFQFSHAPALNFDLIRDTYVLQFWIKRADLAARHFDRCWARFDKVYQEGMWHLPPEKPEIYAPTAQELLPVVAMKPLIPSEVSDDHLSHFCGLPNLPDDTPWPVNERGRPLNHVMQLDCASVASQISGLDLPPLPDTGTLSLFIYDFSEELMGGDVQLVFTPQAPQIVPPRRPPSEVFVRDEYDQHAVRNVTAFADDPDIRLSPRLPFDIVPFTTIAQPAYDDPDYDLKSERQLSDLRSALPHEDDAFPGFTFVLDWLPHTHRRILKDRASDRSRAGRRDSPIRHIPQSYPWRWGDIREALNAFQQNKRDFDRTNDAVLRRLWPGGVIDDLNAWHAMSVDHDPLDRIPEEKRQAYRAWLIALDAAGNTIPQETADETNDVRHTRFDLEDAFFAVMLRLGQPYQYASHGALPYTFSALLHDPEADDFPDDMRKAAGDLLRFDRSYTKLSAYNVVHQPQPHMLFPLIDPSRNNPDAILLFRLNSGYGLPYTFGDCCMLQIWIKPDDLAAQRFDRAWPVVEW